jgi:hypothetical protein
MLSAPKFKLFFLFCLVAWARVSMAREGNDTVFVTFPPQETGSWSKKGLDALMASWGDLRALEEYQRTLSVAQRTEIIELAIGRLSLARFCFEKRALEIHSDSDTAYFMRLVDLMEDTHHNLTFIVEKDHGETIAQLIAGVRMHLNIESSEIID